ncbi:MAG: DUF1080 domain-containing protein [Thermoguttaceae bacterium]|nr:DUF1080 domain-containing protein [Thermoguttaceae bacterium]
MKKNMFSRALLTFAACGVALSYVYSVFSHDLVVPKNENESYGYSDSPQQPWSEYRVHDPSRPIPKKINPEPPTYFPKAPSDAIVLFDGTNVDAWEPTQWKLVDGTIECTVGAFKTKQKFGAFQLHLEWRSPANFEGDWGNQGNNGVSLLGAYEIQIFDSFKINNYPDGACGSVYGQTPPLVNACTPAGNWQTYDIFFTPAKFDGDQQIASPRVTVVQNGIMIQNNTEIYGSTNHFNLPGPNPKGKGPIVLSGHGCPVRFRNIWIRPFDD